VINLNKDMNIKKKPKTKKTTMTTPGTDGVRNYKRANKSKDASSLRQSLQEAIGHSCKVPTAYQIKPKKLKKKTMG